MKPFDEQEIIRLANSQNYADVVWTQLPSGIMQPTIKTGDQKSYVEGARQQYLLDVEYFKELEKELIELRKFREDMIKIAGETYLKLIQK